MARPFHITVKVDSRALQAALSGKAQKKVKWAIAKGLTAVAVRARDYEKAHLSDDFTIRNRWVENSIRMTMATPKTLEARVGSVDDYMVAHEGGGKKKPKSGKESVSVPVGARNPETRVTTKSTWPGQMIKRAEAAAGKRSQKREAIHQAHLKRVEARLAERARKARERDASRRRATFETAAAVVARERKRGKKHAKPLPFLATMNGKQGVWIRTHGGRAPVKALWIIKGSVKVPNDWHLRKRVELVVHSRTGVRDIEGAFETALEEAGFQVDEG